MDLIVDFPQDSRSSFSVSLGTAASDSKRVSFANEMEMKLIDDLSRKYKDDLWFHHEEIHDFKLRTALILSALRRNNMTMAQYAELNSNETSAFMGLESFLSEDTAHMIKVKRRAILVAVTREQRRQDEAGVHDAVAMAKVSEAVSLWSRTRAQIIALIHDDTK